MYDIRDVWTALSLAFKNFLWGTIIAFILFLIFTPNSRSLGEIAVWLPILFFAFILVQSIVIYLTNRRYVINMESGKITFPRSDVENSILGILLLTPYWNLMRTMTINAKDVENLYLNTKRWTSQSKSASGFDAKGRTKFKTVSKKHCLYSLDIVGTFGSAKLDFKDRQKRDEVRNAISQCVKRHTGKSIDHKVAEFG